MANRGRNISKTDTTIEEEPHNEIRRICAPIPGDVNTVMKTTVILRHHGVCIYNCKASDEEPDIFGEIPDDLHWKQFILPRGYKVEETGKETLIVLSDGFKFVCNFPEIGIKKGKEVYLTETYVSLLDENKVNGDTILINTTQDHPQDAHP